ncbi:PE family protein [Mycobacterium simiae]|uniref:PE family protein n=1 Tax=Mycobacterium simiae TaxID=1784 RepID=UPI0027B886BE|nr:PE family protein [Mycobacterium simiae]
MRTRCRQAIAALFSGHAQGNQALTAQAAAFDNQFVQALTAGAGAYTSAEAASASPLQQLARRAQCAHSGVVGTPADR